MSKFDWGESSFDNNKWNACQYQSWRSIALKCQHRRRGCTTNPSGNIAMAIESGKSSFINDILSIQFGCACAALNEDQFFIDRQKTGCHIIRYDHDGHRQFCAGCPAHRHTHTNFGGHNTYYIISIGSLWMDYHKNYHIIILLSSSLVLFSCFCWIYKHRKIDSEADKLIDDIVSQTGSNQWEFFYRNSIERITAGSIVFLFLYDRIPQLHIVAYVMHILHFSLSSFAQHNISGSMYEMLESLGHTIRSAAAQRHFSVSSIKAPATEEIL